MRFTLVAAALLAVPAVSAIHIPAVTKTQFENPYSTTTGDELLKRDAEAGKKVVFNKDYLDRINGETATSSSTVPDPWLRTIYGSIREIVTPTVIGGITFSAKPTDTTTNGLEPWVSLNKDGSPKTIKPKMKNGRIEHGRPDNKHYFETATTVVYDQKELKAHNLKEGDVHEEVVWIPEDETYVSLSPLMRCMPDLYRKREGGFVGNLEPFCSPGENTIIKTGKTHFLTWYTRYFEGAENVKIHYAYVKETAKEKGLKKRDVEEPKSGETISFQGDLPGTFYSSNWIRNVEGFHAIEVDEAWLKGQQYKRVLIAVQPDTVEDEDFDLIESDHVIVRFQKKTTVAKKSKEEKAGITGTGDDVYYVILSIPGVVMIAVFGMYFFLYLNRKHRDLSHIKRPKRSKFGTNGYLPMTSADIRAKHS